MGIFKKIGKAIDKISYGMHAQEVRNSGGAGTPDWLKPATPTRPVDRASNPARQPQVSRPAFLSKEHIAQEDQQRRDALEWSKNNPSRAKGPRSTRTDAVDWGSL